ncbi:MAG: RNA methyltransferase [Cellulomonas sp.]|nr:RNA methyltransferase [Cellulomonas sp.]
MPIISVTDPQDERLRDYFHLTDVALRSRDEPGKGLYMAESSKVIERAIRAGHRPRSFLMTERWLGDLADILAVAALRDGDVPVYIGAPGVVEAITGFNLHRGALAAMHRPPPVALEDLLAGARRIAVLEDIVDHTNVGAVIRSAAALGVDGVVISPRCADPLYRRSVRVSMGAAISLPHHRLAPWPSGLELVRAAGFTLVALALSEDAVTLDEFEGALPPKIAWLLGTEGTGLSPAAIAAADLVVKIPMMAGVDSLNVAAASAVAFWASRPVG